MAGADLAFKTFNNTITVLLGNSEGGYTFSIFS